MKCKACDREVVKDYFCLIHFKAYENIVEKHACWKKALPISWKKYLSEIEHNPLTGEWAKKVASHLI